MLLSGFAAPCLGWLPLEVKSGLFLLLFGGFLGGLRVWLWGGGSRGFLWGAVRLGVGGVGGVGGCGLCLGVVWAGEKEIEETGVVN